MLMILAAIVMLAASRRGQAVAHKHVLLPIVFAVLSGAFQAVVIVGNKLLLPRMDYYALNFVEVIAALAAFAVLSGRSLLEVFAPSNRQALGLAIVSGIAGRGFGCLFLLIGIKYVDSIVVAPISNSSMFFAIFFGALILKEPVFPVHVLSAVVAFVGAVLIIVR
jgi:drug/metabolite transporter (DMT)-like permease